MIDRSRSFIAVATAFVTAVAVSPAMAASAPAALFNKTIHLAWAQSMVQKAPDGSIVSPTMRQERTIYVSSQGRVFLRASRSINNRQFSGSKTGELAPGASAGYAGGAASVRFEGNTLVGSLAHSVGASQFTVKFDSGFTSCSMDVTYGRANGQLKWKGLDGRMYEVQSVQGSGYSCSISAGNAFAE